MRTTKGGGVSVTSMNVRRLEMPFDSRSDGTRGPFESPRRARGWMLTETLASMEASLRLQSKSSHRQSSLVVNRQADRGQRGRKGARCPDRESCNSGTRARKREEREMH